METVSIWAAPPAHGTSAPARHFETAFALCLKLSGAAGILMRLPRLAWPLWVVRDGTGAACRLATRSGHC
jgi:hypothetical protein